MGVEGEGGVPYLVRGAHLEDQLAGVDVDQSQDTVLGQHPEDFAGPGVAGLHEEEELTDVPHLGGELDDPRQGPGLRAPHVEEGGPAPAHQDLPVLGGGKGPVVWGGAGGGGEEVLVLQRVCLPGVDGVVFETGDNGV